MAFTAASSSGFFMESTNKAKVQPFGLNVSGTYIANTKAGSERSPSQPFKMTSSAFNKLVTPLSQGFSVTARFCKAPGGINMANSITFGSSLPTTMVSGSFKGLGGTSVSSYATSSTNPGFNPTDGTQVIKTEKLTDWLDKDVIEFQKFMDDQKESSDNVGKFSIWSLEKLGEEAVTVSYALGSVSSGHHRSAAAVKKMKSDFGQEMKNTKMAKYSKDIPSSLQHSNVAPAKFYMYKVLECERNMQIYQKQIEELENHLDSTDQSTNLTAQDIFMALCKMQELFVNLAASLHHTHSEIKNLKENFLLYREIVHNDTTDIFIQQNKKPLSEITATPCGISPVSKLKNFFTLAMATVANHSQQQISQNGFLSSLPAGTSGFLLAPKPTGSTAASSSFNGSGAFEPRGPKPLSAGFSTTISSKGTPLIERNVSAGSAFACTTGSTTFELKRPPPGNKRWKK